MPIAKLTNEIINAAIFGFEEQKRQIDSQISELQAMLSGAPASAPAETTDVTPTGRPRRKVSAAGRKAMAEAQRKRWAALKGTSEPKKTPTPTPTAKPAKKKRKLSAAGRAAVIAANKKMWAARRAAAKKSV
jgi:hypothetical protein